MGTFASGERKNIERLCCYIKDDSMIATYVGVPKSEVVRIRAKARRAPSERIGPSLDGPPKASERPDNSSVIQRTNAAQGSADLLKALERHYTQTAKRLRIPSEFHDRRIDFAKARSEEHTSELQSLMRISYAVFCLKQKKQTHKNK